MANHYVTSNSSIPRPVESPLSGLIRTRKEAGWLVGVEYGVVVLPLDVMRAADLAWGMEELGVGGGGRKWRRQVCQGRSFAGEETDPFIYEVLRTYVLYRME